MKKLFTLLTFFLYVNTYSQLQYSYALNQSPIADITGIAIKDNFLYFGSYTSDGIKKINLTGSQYQIPTVVVSNISGIMDLQFYGNDLYISQFGGGTIKKVDVTGSNPVLVDVINGVSAPAGIQFYNNYLYIGEAYGYKISRINLSLANPILETVITYANSPWKIQVFGDEMYVAETYGNKISKFNLLDTNPILIDVINNTYPYCMSIKDNFLYYNSNTIGSISKINLTTSSTVSFDINLSDWYNQPGRWIIHGNILYRSSNNSIRKYDLNSTLGLGEVLYEDKISFFPNPAQNNITFNKEVKTVSLYTLDGKLLNTQLVNNQINLSGFNSGIYLVRGTTIDGVSFSEKLVKN